jgi:hypothetical protein
MGFARAQPILRATSSPLVEERKQRPPPVARGSTGAAAVIAAGVVVIAVATPARWPIGLLIAPEAPVIRAAGVVRRRPVAAPARSAIGVAIGPAVPRVRAGDVLVDGKRLRDRVALGRRRAPVARRWLGTLRVLLAAINTRIGAPRVGRLDIRCRCRAADCIRRRRGSIRRGLGGGRGSNGGRNSGWRSIVRGVRVPCGSLAGCRRRRFGHLRFGELRFGQLGFSRLRCLRFDGGVSGRQPGRAFDRWRMLAEHGKARQGRARAKAGQTARDDQCRFERPSTSPQHRYRSPSRPRGSARRGSVSAEASHAIEGVEVSILQAKGLQQVRRLEQENGVVRRRHFDGAPDDLVPPLPRACAIKERIRHGPVPRGTFQVGGASIDGYTPRQKK